MSKTPKQPNAARDDVIGPDGPIYWPVNSFVDAGIDEKANAYVSLSLVLRYKSSDAEDAEVWDEVVSFAFDSEAALLVAQTLLQTAASAEAGSNLGKFLLKEGFSGGTLRNFFGAVSRSNHEQQERRRKFAGSIKKRDQKVIA